MTTRRDSCAHRHGRSRASAGLLLPELMACLALSMPVVLYAVKLGVDASREQLRAAQVAVLEQDAQYALNMLLRALQLLDPQPPDEGTREPALRGFDDATLSASEGLGNEDPRPGLMGSDALIIRQRTTSADHNEDTGAVDCASMPLPAAGAGAGSAAQGYSAFYLARGAGGLPELRCLHRTASGWDAEALVSGVENFQVLFGLDRDDDGLPDQFVRASVIAEEDRHASPSGHPPEQMPAGHLRSSPWDRIVALKIALLMRSARHLPSAQGESVWHLFGHAYSAQHATVDRGTRLLATDFSDGAIRPLRRVIERVIFLRNRPDGGVRDQDITGA